MTPNDNATKADIAAFVRHIDSSIHDLYEANERWKEEIKHEFHIVAEQIRHDVGRSQDDRITAVEHDVLRLKKHTGLAV